MTNDLESISSELPETDSSINSVTKFKKIISLRSRLLTTILPTVLLPLIIASTIGYNLIEHTARNEIIEEIEDNIEADTLLASKAITNFIQDSFEIIDVISANPNVLESMKIGNQKAQEQKLIQQTISQLEKQFANTKLLTVDDRLNNYLREIVKSSKVIAIVLTERHGFNLAFSTPTSDFIQRDEDWWKMSRQKEKFIDLSISNKSIDQKTLILSQAVKAPKTEDFLGVIRVNIPMKTLNDNLTAYLDGEYEQYYQFQIFDSKNSLVLSNIYSKNNEVQLEKQPDNTITEEKANKIGTIKNTEVIGGEITLKVAEIMIDVTTNTLSLEEAEELIAQQFNFADFNIRQEEIFSASSSIVTLFRINNDIYSLSTIPNTSLVSIGTVNYDVIPTVAQEFILIFVLTAIVLGSFSIGLILLLARQLSEPLSNLSVTTQEITKGNLELEANLQGTREAHILADNFNNLIKQIKESLQKQQTLANEQRLQKEQLEKAIYILINEVSDATEGDLTVRANLESLEMSTVADLFNAIIDSLREIAIETKQSTSQVDGALRQNESEIRFLAEQAVAQVKETQDTLLSVKQMSKSIQEVAKNASKAEKIADDTFNTVLHSSNNMDLTVDSILELRKTVGETAKKMKRLGESSQRISQVVSFIEEIALKTNVLAINASVEARRAGEYGQGFTIVAEQVGALAEQSAAATQKIANIVGKIQAETLEVSQAMESGTTQVINSTRRVESTKESLSVVLEKSQAINQLMGSISQTTISQANTSQNVTNLMQRIARLSKTTSISSKKVAHSIAETAEITKKLESAVAKFKVSEES